MKQKFDVEAYLADIKTFVIYEGVEANTKAEALVIGEHLAIQYNPGHIVGKIKATLSAKRIDAERREAAARAMRVNT